MHQDFLLCVELEYAIIIRVTQMSASLPPGDTRGPKFSPVAFVGLAARTKLQPLY